jgi:hypothetical protein
MTKRTIALALAFCVALAGPLLAHGGYTHVMGTVTAVDATHLEVKTTAGKMVSMKLSDATTYKQEKGGAAATAADLKVGQHVLVDAKGHGADLEASEVRIGAMAKASTAPAK